MKHQKTSIYLCSQGTNTLQLQSMYILWGVKSIAIAAAEKHFWEYRAILSQSQLDRQFFLH